jgi:IclR family transcriptional regulator, KDG regulon repressor
MYCNAEQRAMIETRTKSQTGVQSVLLALRVLEQLASHDAPFGVTALATALGTTKNRVHRHLRTLVQQGYVMQLPDEKYCVGNRLIGLGRSAAQHDRLSILADQHMRELRDALGYGIGLGRIEPEGLRVIASLPGRSTVHIAVRDGTLVPLHATAMGKVVLAFGSELIREQLFRHRLAAFTPQTIAKHAALRKDIENVRRRGWATSPNELVIGLNALAAPVFDAIGQLCATVAIVDSVQFITGSPTSVQIARTVTAARRLSAALGYKA